MTTPREILDFYTRPAAMTSGGAHAPRFDELPGDVASLVRVVQGLLLHLHWAQAYGVELSDERRGESHLRPTDRTLDRLLADEPLRDDQLALFDRLAAITRAPDARFAELRQLYEGDERLRVPAVVFNAVLNRQDSL
ncbi:hypothetical protein [Sorangium sp. So ce124]|uniref:hypothetical protein n=1 Tax=Sorangium sp. So ce124 TaxID=3133280 RepID=UPI003F629CF0